MRKTGGYILAGLALCTLAVWPAAIDACVGKTLFLGRLPGLEQEIMTEMFVWLVSERTGTSIEVKPFDDSRSTHSALEKAKIDIYLEDPIVALREILGLGKGLPGGNDVGSLVRKEYKERFNLIWLEPWGPDGKAVEGGQTAKVAPVIRRDTLKKFPALSRLVNKMSGVIDGAVMEQLLAESSKNPVRQVTKKFLKEKKLI